MLSVPGPAHRALIWGVAVVAAAGSVTAAVALNRAQDDFEAEHSRPVAVGDCVVVAAPNPELVHTRRADCSADPSYTVGALATSTGECPSAEYQHFPAPAADRATASLCLVPNLVAKHCYRLNMPVGVMELAGCTETDTEPDDGLLVRVTHRFDTRDQGACPDVSGHHAWPYPSPARTYCTATID